MQGAPTNKPVTSEEIRRAWLDFFKGKGHLEMPSSSLVPHDDPTVLLTTAGMQQMIPFMLGREQPPRRRLVSIQKCFRTTDIDSVGNLRNLTFFEMLGNFSIGDYFKAEAIAWAWEFVLDWLKLPADRLWITVHPTDDEAVDLWLRTGVPRERIVPLEENWWGPPGLSGPCGPDSELYLDRGEALGCGRPDCKPGCDCERFLEFWNLVFMQYYQDEHGHRTPLAQKNIDTGAGLERLSAIMQECRSVYETDLFRPIVAGVERLTGLTYGASPEQDFGLRVLADHGRGMTFLVGDGVVPSNEGRGYVLRRIVRRAVRYGRLLGLDRPFLTHIVDLVIDRMGKVYPSLIADRERIRQTVATEEERFAATLQAGLALLERWTAEARDRGERSLSGELVFKLYDTYGFPKELTAEILRERGLTFDEDEYRRAMEEQRARSRAAGRFAVAGRALGTALDVPRTEFLGYEATSAEGRVLALQRDGVPVEAMGEGETGVVVLDRTPFYAEAGGQVGDTGVLVGPAGRFLVEDTQSDGAGHHLHLGRVVEGVLQLGETVQATVDARRREDIMRHHTVTHLLHQALQDVLGPHALQAGSLVSPDVARFDFAHPRPVSPEELERVAEIVNQKILADAPVTATWMSLEEARSLGAKMLFGEKYGERVRVVSIDGYSRELCGGTHVVHTGQLGLALIVSESGVGSGIRRVEVLAGRRAMAYLAGQLQQVHEIGSLLNVPPERAAERVRNLLEELHAARREAERLAERLAEHRAEELLGRVVEVNGVPVLASEVDARSVDELGRLHDLLRRRLPRGVIVLGAVVERQPRFVVGVSRDVLRKDFDARTLVREVAAVAGGGGGGRPEFATGGGRDVARLPEALRRALEVVASATGG